MRTGESVFLRADGRWEARYQKYRDENGKIKYGFVYGTTKEGAEESVRKLSPNYKRSLLWVSHLPCPLLIPMFP